MGLFIFLLRKSGGEKSSYDFYPVHWQWVIRSGLVSIYIQVYQNIFFELYFSDRLTFSNIRGRTSHQIYRLALPLLSPKTLSSSSKARIFLYNAHLALFVRKDDTITHTNASVSVVM